MTPSRCSSSWSISCVLWLPASSHRVVPHDGQWPRDAPGFSAKWSWGTPFLMTEHGVYLRERYLSYLPGTLSQAGPTIVLRFFKLLVKTPTRTPTSSPLFAGTTGYGKWPTGRLRRGYARYDNGIYLNSFPAAATDPAVPTLVFVGRIDPLKDIETLLRAFAEVRSGSPGAGCGSSGRPRGRRGLLQKVPSRWLAELGLDDGSATFEGPISPTVAAYHAGHVLVLTSISEGLPYVVLEAMASGSPVVATDVGGVAEAVGSAGL